MTLAEKLKNMRRNAGLSQEALAEKLGVSRQAITKWETEAGTPDIGNLLAIAGLFGVSVDELLTGEKPQAPTDGFLYESVTEYDIDRPKRYDMKLGGARRLVLCGYVGEKIRVRLASNSLPSIQSDLKLKIDDVRDRIDLDISRKNGLTEAQAKEALTIFVQLPAAYIRHIELAANGESVELKDLTCEQIELNVKAQSLKAENVNSEVEVDCNLDMNVECRGLSGSLALNQICATSRLTVPADWAFRSVVKGLGNSVRFEKNGQPCEDPGREDAEDVVELNGMKSELMIVLAENEK